MKRALFAGVAALAMLAAGQALAERVVIKIAPDQRARIRDYVVREHVRPIIVRERLRVGATLPADVELRTVPASWGADVARYRYVYYDHNVFLVDPDDRRVIEEIQ